MPEMAKSDHVHDYKDAGGRAKQDAKTEDERYVVAYWVTTSALNLKAHKPLPQHPLLPMAQVRF